MVSASIPFVILPSSEVTPTNRVKTIPNIHIIDEFKNLGILSILTLSDIFEIIFNATAIKLTGIKIVFMKFPIKVISNNIIGCNIPADAIFPSSNH